MSGKPKQILHILDTNSSFYVKPFANLIKQNFDEDHQLLNSLTLTAIDYNKKNVGKSGLLANIKFFWKHRKDIIIFHSLFLPINMLLALLIVRPKQMAWVIWGGDLYLKDALSLKDKIYDRLMKALKKQVPYYITHINKDFDLAQQKYNQQAQQLYGFYSISFSESNNHAHSEISKDLIQIGNSRSKFNHHMEVLEVFAKIGVGKNRLFLPLAYGSHIAYAQKVRDYIKAHFDEGEVLILNELIPLEEYKKILNKVKVAIFNHQRQQAIGNIILLIAEGVTVYIRDDISTWSFLKDHGLHVRCVGDFLQDKKIRLLTADEVAHNIKQVRQCFSMDECIKRWGDVFQRLL